MDISSVFGSGDSLKAADLQGRDAKVVIESVEVKEFQNGNKLVIRFQGRKKHLICNVTNAKRIALLHGSDYEKWVGCEITLYPDLVDFQGKDVEGIRVRPPANRSVAAPAARTGQPTKPATVNMDDDIPFAPEWR